MTDPISTGVITIIGTGHVFKIAEPVAFIVKNTWPDAVLIELDEKRYKSLTSEKQERQDMRDMPKILRRSAEYQDKMSEKNDTRTGGEMLAAINSGILVGAEIICIDTDAEKVMTEMWEEMSFIERTRYNISGVWDALFNKRGQKKLTKVPSADDKDPVDIMRKKYPTLVRKLIDERNVFMADKIRKASEHRSNIIVVVGDAHVKGISKLLEDKEIRTIRLYEILDKESLDKVKSRIWNENPGREPNES
ncbi:MAG: TraB/GumN family protein [Candidatus Methanoplasma sp.]|nr:TraB/GumN family protein [Candidatus Methanoplasma sp.]